MQRSRLFSLDEANAILPEITDLLENIRQLKDVYDRRHDVLLFHELISQAERTQKVCAPEEPERDYEKEISELENEIYSLKKEIEKVHALGCVIRSLENGVVEFPAEKNGRQIFYVWKRGESKISGFRTADEIRTTEYSLKEGADA